MKIMKINRYEALMSVLDKVAKKAKEEDKRRKEKRTVRIMKNECYKHMWR